jgi:hypothetical protein
MPLLNKGFHNNPQYRKYTKVRYILATKNLELKQVDKNFAQEHPRIDLWDEQLTRYY